MSAWQLWPSDTNLILPWIDGSYTTPWDTTLCEWANIQYLITLNDNSSLCLDMDLHLQDACEKEDTLKFVNYLIPAIAMLASTTTNASATEAEWDGPYVGLHAGYTAMKPDYSEVDEPLLRANPNTDGIAGGVLAGYNMQSNGVVVGLEADFGLTSADAGANPNADNDFSAFKAKWNGHLRAKVGVPVGKTLIFAAGGLALTHLQVDDVDEGWDEDCSTLTGFSIGGGVEHAVSDRMSMRAEYLYDKYGKKAGSIDGDYVYPYRVDPSAHSLRAAVVYRF